ncbi:MAG: diacylglycerol/lipid kinase family protein [Pseudomonadota bacterium]
MTILLIEHTASRRSKRWSRRYRKWFEQQRKSVLQLSINTEEKTDILQLHRYLERANEIVLLAGDGSLHWLVNQLTDEQAQRLIISVIPCGTGNDFARDCGLTELNWRMRDETELSHHRLDIGEVNGIRFVNAVSAGLPVDLVRGQSLQQKKWFGRLSYLLGVLGWWWRYQPGKGNGLLLQSVLVGRYLGGGIQLAPMATRQNGKLTRVSVAAAPKLKLLGVLWAVLNGKHARHPLVTIEQHDNYIIKPSVLEIDGEVYDDIGTEIVACVSRVSCRVRTHKLE